MCLHHARDDVTNYPTMNTAVWSEDSTRVRPFQLHTLWHFSMCGVLRACPVCAHSWMFTEGPACQEHPLWISYLLRCLQQSTSKTSWGEGTSKGPLPIFIAFQRGDRNILLPSVTLLSVHLRLPPVLSSPIMIQNICVGWGLEDHPGHPSFCSWGCGDSTGFSGLFGITGKSENKPRHSVPKKQPWRKGWVCPSGEAEWRLDLVSTALHDLRLTLLCVLPSWFES